MANTNVNVSRETRNVVSCIFEITYKDSKTKDVFHKHVRDYVSLLTAVDILESSISTREYSITLVLYYDNGDMESRPFVV